MRLISVFMLVFGLTMMGLAIADPLSPDASAVDAAVDAPAPDAGSPVAAVPDPEADPGGFLASLVSLLKAGAYWSLLGGVMVGVAYLLRAGKRWVKWLGTRHGGIFVAFASGALVMLGQTLAMGSPLTMELVVGDGALLTLVGAALRQMTAKAAEGGTA